MTRHLQPVDQRARARTLNSRREIEEWVAERRAVLTALVEAERLGEGSGDSPEPCIQAGQLRLGEVA